MFSKINQMENLLLRLMGTLEKTETKRYTANQAFKAENIQLAEGATINISMNNTIVSVETVQECLQLLNDLKPLLPITGQNDLKTSLLNYENTIVRKALEESKSPSDVTKKLGITKRQLRYWIAKNKLKSPKKMIENKDTNIFELEKVKKEEKEKGEK